jgi:hypothetical protein
MAFNSFLMTRLGAQRGGGSVLYSFFVQYLTQRTPALALTVISTA